MISIIEKLLFIARGKSRLVSRRPKKVNHQPESGMARTLRRSAKIIGITFATLFSIGLIIYYLSPPTITVNDSSNGVIQISDPNYTIIGTVSSGNESQVKINGEQVELIDDTFFYKPELEEGDNEFTIEATNKRGTAEKLIVVRLSLE